MRSIDETEEVELQDMHSNIPNRKSKLVKGKRDSNMMYDGYERD